jgi:hypothetical protein
MTASEILANPGLRPAEGAAIVASLIEKNPFR